jgi:hypothetical protein
LPVEQLLAQLQASEQDKFAADFRQWEHLLRIGD